MNHLPQLIRDLGLILILAGIMTLVFKRLNQPVVLGYILAGLLVGPYIPLFPSITDGESIRIWADIGVIILLFGLGLEFSFKKLMKVGGSASVTAFIEISAMLGIGYLVGYALGWPLMDRIFLGGILSIASTTIILRSLTEMGLKGKRFSELVFGILIIEDLIAVVLLVLLSTIAVSRQFAGMEMIGSILKLGFFLTLWFVAGIFFIPSLLSKVQKYLNDETLLIVSLGLCLVMVMLSSSAGFSPALGAFIMGSILAETTKAERIEKAIKPISDLFGAIFFVSVGMLINPAVLVEYWKPIVLITAVLLIAKTLHVTLGAVIAGNPLKTSLSAGMSMAQIGEFSFIIATLGVSLKVTSDFLYPVAVAVSAITTFSTPYMIRLADPLYRKIEVMLPAKWKKTLDRYSAGAQTINAASDWQIVLRSYFFHIILFSIIIIGIILVFLNFVSPWVSIHIKNQTVAMLLAGGLCFVALSPFLWALTLQKIKPKNTANLWGVKRYRGPLIALRLMRAAIGIAFVCFSFLLLFPLTIALIGVAILMIASIFLSRKMQQFYIKIEERFFSNFNAREAQSARINRHELAPWDAHIVRYDLHALSPITGKTLEEVSIREQYGINIAMIKRGDSHTIAAPGRTERLYPGDTLFIIGTDEQIDQFRRDADAKPADINNYIGKQEISLVKVAISETSVLAGKTIRESGVREKTNGLVVGIERRGRRILNPESDIQFAVGDKIWIVGDARLIKAL
ncbi:MAG: sodium:proton antiporter [Bacteroidetes bacterium 43-93]|nr:cation:proton antiporter [Bacteroidota bacterium]OJW99130.1 MAG: sodium:proton antiporter [Bacteroidetes bacterium 43-93]